MAEQKATRGVYGIVIDGVAFKGSGGAFEVKDVATGKEYGVVRKQGTKWVADADKGITGNSRQIAALNLIGREVEKGYKVPSATVAVKVVKPKAAKEAAAPASELVEAGITAATLAIKPSKAPTKISRNQPKPPPAAA